MWISPDTFRAYVREAAESLPHHGIDRVVFVNGHGGNVEALAEVARRFSRDDGHDGYAVAFTWFEAVGEHAGDMGPRRPAGDGVVARDESRPRPRGPDRGRPRGGGRPLG